MGDAAVFADEILGFHVQQAAEKLLKAWLALPGWARSARCRNDLAALLDIAPRGRRRHAAGNPRAGTGRTAPQTGTGRSRR